MSDVNDGTVTCGGTVAAASCSLTWLTPGPKTLRATYAGDGNYTTSISADVPHTVNLVGTATRITGDTPDPSVVGQVVPVTYEVTATDGGTPSGNVTVTDGADSCVGTVATGRCDLSSTTAGGKTLTATYQGDPSHDGSTSAGEAHGVDPAGTTTTTAAVTSNPFVTGQSVTFNYTVTVSTPGSGTPTGTVTVSDGTQSCSGSVATGSCSIAFNSPGERTVVGTYAGDANFAQSASAGVAYSVEAASTTTTLTGSTANPSVTGEAVTFSYTVTANAPGSGTPTGAVTVSDGTQSCTGTVAAGGCSIGFTSAGGRTVTATYAGDGNYNGSNSGGVTHTVNPAATTTVIISHTPDPSETGQSVTFNYTVTVNPPGSGTPTGTVAVSDGSQTCTADVAAGSCSIAFSSAGGRTVTATYAGDVNFSGSPSAGVTHTVNPPPGATKLSITTPPSNSAQSGMAFGRQPVIQVQDGKGGPMSQSASW